MKNIAKFISCILLTLATGGISGFATASEIKGWYLSLNKPSFNPPNYLFGPVWTLLYFLMGISLFIIIITKNNNKKQAIAAFAVQLILNFFWSIIFFRWHQIGAALAEIAMLWLSIIAMIITFYKINRIAGLLQIPYLMWVSFASALNAAIFMLN